MPSAFNLFLSSLSCVTTGSFSLFASSRMALDNNLYTLAEELPQALGEVHSKLKGYEEDVSINDHSPGQRGFGGLFRGHQPVIIPYPII